jgi:biphenyl 2,3-dioxygenase ferredoxin subunit
MAEFIKACNVDEVEEGSGKQCSVGGRTIAVFNSDNQFFATQDECTHGFASLADGYVEECTIECPLHQGTFDLRTGAVMSPPCVVPIEVFKTEVRGNEIFVSLEKE